MKFPAKNDTKIELILFTFFPFYFFFASSEIFIDFEKEPVLRIALGLFLGGIGAAAGFGMYTIGKTKNLSFKIVAGIILILICIGYVRTAAWYQKNNVETCEICGYKSIQEKECAVCGSDTWKIEKLNGFYASKHEWIFENQLFWFENQDFYAPKEIDGFVKDSNWKPTVSRKEINDLNE